jgi:hypothetical protein
MDDICLSPLVYLVFFVAAVLAGIAPRTKLRLADGWTMKGWRDAG